MENDIEQICLENCITSDSKVSILNPIILSNKLNEAENKIVRLESISKTINEAENYNSTWKSCYIK
jgi:hypothetical protein